MTRFERIRIGEVVTDAKSSLGTAWADFNNDNNIDIFVVNRNNQSNDLYLNEGDGLFTKLLGGAIVEDLYDSYGVTCGDYDNDGFVDLYIANKGQVNLLFRNLGADGFDRVLIGEVAEDRELSNATSFGDFNNDGYLDIFVANDLNNNNSLYENRGDGTFQKITTVAPTTDGGHSVNCQWVDVDNDGNLDLFVVNFREANFLYRNNGDRTFTRITEGAIVTDAGPSFGASWGDLNNDGLPDLFIANDVSDSFPNGEDNALYVNLGDFRFEKVTDDIVSRDQGISFGSSFADMDNDGDIDLFVANKNGKDNFLYENHGDGSFQKVITNFVIDDEGYSYGAAWGDFDNNGYPDLYVANQDEGNFLYQNTTSGNHWLSIRLAGTISNRSAIGARVRVKARIFGSDVWQVREISALTGGGYSGQNSLNASFGLGDAPKADSVEVLWPSGITQLMSEITGDQFISITEETDGRDRQAPVQRSLIYSAVIDHGLNSDLSTSLTDNHDVEHATLHFRVGGTSGFVARTMSRIDSVTYVASVQASEFQDKGFEFYIEAADSAGNILTTDRKGVAVSLLANHFTVPHTGGNIETAYRLISMPLFQNDPSIESTLYDDLGQPDSLLWRLWEIDPAKREADFPFREIFSGEAIVPGAAKFLIARHNINLTSAEGVTVNTSQPFEIELGQGWNLIANPFNFVIPISQVYPDSLRPHITTYDSSGWSAGQIVSLEPFKGYAVNAKEETALRIEPFPSDVQNASATNSVLSNHVAKRDTRTEWTLRLEARAGRAVDGNNFVGVSYEASDSWDRLERFDPPPIGRFVRLSFIQNDWSVFPDRYTTDFRPPGSAGYEWDFTVDTANPGVPIRLSVLEVDMLPADLDALLVDPVTGIVQNLRDNNHYVFSTSHMLRERKLSIMVVRSEQIDEVIRSTEMPDRLHIESNFPNPFNPATTIKFGLPAPDILSLQIYDILGKRIRTLASEVQYDRGYHAIVWDGRDDRGVHVASGIYLLRLTAGNRSDLIKMTLLR
jgi:hypothetical protein